MWPFKYKYDAFISHAVEDKIPVANELSIRLENAGLKIWYSGKELTVGDSIEKTIHKGLDESRYGIVILTPTYVNKNWTMREFYTLLSREIQRRKVILPVLYNITVDELREQDITMVDKYALSFDKGMDYVVERLLSHIRKKQRAVRSKILATLFSVLLVSGLGYVFFTQWHGDKPGPRLVEQAIKRRMADFQEAISQNAKVILAKANAKPVTAEEVKRIFSDFNDLNAYYRNEYEFTNGFTTIRFKKNVERALRIELDGLSPFNNYQFTLPLIYLAEETNNRKRIAANYKYINTQPTSYTILSEEVVSEGQYEVTVGYDNYVRSLSVNLIYPTAPEVPKKHQVLIEGFLPIEQYRFVKNGQSWQLLPASADTAR